MADLSKHQKKIVERYYDQRDAIMLNKLQELVTELYLAESESKASQLWTRVDSAMANLKVKPQIREHILASRDAAVLADHVRDWLKAAGPGA
jgi:hypothetical protein